MAEVNTDQGGGKEKGGKHSKVRAKKASTHIDMTPMVDLAFLLLTFFMLTTTFSKPKTVEINMPLKDGEPTKVNNAITVLLSDKDKVFWYFGEFKPDETQLNQTDFSDNGIRKILLDKNSAAHAEVKRLEDELAKRQIADSTFKRLAVEAKSQKSALMVLIKTDDKAKYRNVIDILDELSIASVGKYAVVDMMKDEYDLIQKMN
ncbi:MAG: biopolymer transporter ExbD [Bacteroidetes bacterium]|jgi:biopolymer transport protein ExbD|nr:biopolymer transporter ExbD [Bacteroidota bacterium]MBX7237881.1 biopolymer transporter ExbD [Bacteroidia bacterium]MCC7515598.1 biopolymer transporter ExbD [Bacteroidia bacterium]MCW5918915.1 biopolymer transporter ExbD [Bacteroidota bacterium]HNB32816.1 biopolymer transporter ExbD [Bacteroidia bacterium]